MRSPDLEGKIQTVLGVIDSGELGVTSCHEHILWDMSVYFEEPPSASDKGLAHQPVCLENLYWVRANPTKNVDNMIQTDELLAAKEVLRFKHAGGGAIVELSQHGLSRDPLGLARVARATGLNIVMGSGYYVSASHPPDIDTRTEEQIAQEIIDDLLVGVGTTGIRSGIIGEIGCSTPFMPNEKKVLRACSIAQRQTGAPMNIHPSIGDKVVLENIEVLIDSGADLSHIAVSHIDGYGFSQTTIHRILEAGCYVEYDGFGQALYHFSYMGEVINGMSDMDRIRDIMALIDDGYIRQILIGQDFCFKCDLASYGGYGYDHILRNLTPVMRAKGMTGEQIEMLLVRNPARFLAFAPVAQ